MRRQAGVLALALTAVAAMPLDLAAQSRSGVLTLAQVERKYPAMNAVHIVKCDKAATASTTAAKWPA